MTVAAVIPTYNAAAFIERTLACVYALSRMPDELIVVDDASTDDTANIARKFGATVIILEKNSGGPAKPLNVGIAAAKSEWIATLDHDDRWDPGWLDAALKAATAAGVELVFGRVRRQVGQDDLDARCNGLARLGTQVTDTVVRLEGRTAYNELVPALNYAVTCSNMVFSRQLGESTEFDGSVRLCCDYRFLQEATLLHDIAFVSAYSCDWLPTPASLYQRCDMDALDRDLFYIYRQFDRVMLDATNRAIVREKSRRLGIDLAYAARGRGQYWRAACDYFFSMYAGGVNRTALAGLLKLPFAAS